MTILTIINDNPADYDFNETKRRMIEDYDYEDNISDEVVWNRIYNEIDCCYNKGMIS